MLEDQLIDLVAENPPPSSSPPIASGVGRDIGPGLPGGGGGRSSRFIAVIIGTASIGTRSGGPQEAIAIRAWGLRKPLTLAAAPSPSGSKMIPQRERAASKVSAGKSCERVLRGTRCSRAQRSPPARCRSSIPVEMSLATTLPSAPTTLAAVSVGSPYPAATSRTRSTAMFPAISTIRSLTCERFVDNSSSSSPAAVPSWRTHVELAGVDLTVGLADLQVEFDVIRTRSRRRPVRPCSDRAGRWRSAERCGRPWSAPPTRAPRR